MLLLLLLLLLLEMLHPSSFAVVALAGGTLDESLPVVMVLVGDGVVVPSSFGVREENDTGGLYRYQSDSSHNQ